VEDSADTVFLSITGKSLPHSTNILTKDGIFLEASQETAIAADYRNNNVLVWFGLDNNNNNFR
jgi:hypothetical protein